MEESVRTQASFNVICKLPNSPCEHLNCVHLVKEDKGYRISFCLFAIPETHHIDCKEI